MDWHGHRDRGFGLANTLAAIEAGATRVHGTALGIGERSGNTEMDILLVNLKLLGVETADALARIVVSIGLAQNFAAMRALATTGIQKGHMALHAQNVALMVGAVGDEIDLVASELKTLGKVRQDLAEEILKRIRGDK